MIAAASIRIARLLVLSSISLAVAGISIAVDAPKWDPMLAEMGAERFATRCSSCHGAGGRGDGPVASELKTKPADLTQISKRRGGKFPSGEIARFIDGRFSVVAHGTREMPIWGEQLSATIAEPGLGDEIARGEIATLVEFLKSIQRD